MAHFRKMDLSLHEKEDDSSMFGDGGFVMEEFQSGESDYCPFLVGIGLLQLTWMCRFILIELILASSEMKI